MTGRWLERIGWLTVVATLAGVCVVVATRPHPEKPLTATDVQALVRQNVEDDDMTLKFLTVEGVDGAEATIRFQVAGLMPRPERRVVTVERGWHVVAVRTAG